MPRAPHTTLEAAHIAHSYPRQLQALPPTRARGALPFVFLLSPSISCRIHTAGPPDTRQTATATAAPATAIASHFPFSDDLLTPDAARVV